jgi:hypothetical protein
MSLLPPPPAPQTSAPTTFAGLADGFIAWISASLVPYLNALGTPGLGGGALTGALDFATPVIVASAASPDISAGASNIIYLSGVVTVSSFVNPVSGIAGAIRVVKHTGIHQLTNSANLILVGAANRTYQVGDVSTFVYEGASVWREYIYQNAAENKIVSILVAASSAIFVLPSGYTRYEIEITNLVLSAAAANLSFQTSQDGGSTFQTASYLYGLAGTDATANSRAGYGSVSAAALLLASSVQNAASSPINIERITLHDPSLTNTKQIDVCNSSWVDNSSSDPVQGVTGGGRYFGSTNPYNAYKIFPSSGTMTGTITMRAVR